MTVVLPRAVGDAYGARGVSDDSMPPGHWLPISLDADAWYREMAWCLLKCPDCKRPLSLSRAKHQVAADGAIAPSLVCPHEGCGWHVFARLDGWEA